LTYYYPEDKFDITIFNYEVKAIKKEINDCFYIVQDLVLNQD